MVAIYYSISILLHSYIIITLYDSSIILLYYNNIIFIISILYYYISYIHIVLQYDIFIWFRSGLCYAYVYVRFRLGFG